MKVFTQKEIKEIKASDKIFESILMRNIKSDSLRGSLKNVAEEATVIYNNFFDKLTSADIKRQYNIELLESLGFEECGAWSRSGHLRAEVMKNGTIKVVFGMRSAVGGKYPKYFSLVKKYDSFKEYKNEWKKIEKKMKVKK